MNKLLAIICALGVGACGGDDSIGPGDQTFTPPPMNDGSGKPPGSTSVTCVAATDCDFWFCGCTDGAVVNSALCVNGYCMDAASACPEACATFDHGGWTGQAGGGPGTDPGPQSCGGFGSSNPTCDACFVDACCAQGEACDANAACTGYFDCAATCGGDPSCLDDCGLLYPGGIAPYDALASCLASQCSSACP